MEPLGCVLDWKQPRGDTPGLMQPAHRQASKVHYLFQFLFALRFGALRPLPSCSSPQKGRVPLLKPQAVLVSSATWEAGGLARLCGGFKTNAQIEGTERRLRRLNLGGRPHGGHCSLFGEKHRKAVETCQHLPQPGLGIRCREPPVQRTAASPRHLPPCFWMSPPSVRCCLWTQVA